MNHLRMIVFATGTLLCATSMSAVARQCTFEGETWREGNIQYTCVRRAFEQAGSELESLRQGLGGCVYDNSGRCVPNATQPYTPAGRDRATRKFAFPGLSDREWKQLQGSREGKDLIRRADSLRIQQQAARKELGEIKNSPLPYKDKAVAMGAVNLILDTVGNSIDKLQSQATKIIEIQMH